MASPLFQSSTTLSPKVTFCQRERPTSGDMSRYLGPHAQTTAETAYAE